MNYNITKYQKGIFNSINGTKTITTNLERIDIVYVWIDDNVGFLSILNSKANTNVSAINTIGGITLMNKNSFNFKWNNTFSWNYVAIKL